MPVQPLTYRYLPLLEGAAGKVYLKLGSTDYASFLETFNGYTPTTKEYVTAGGVSIASSSNPMYSGLVSIYYNDATTRTELKYNGGNWPALSPATSFLQVNQSDIAWAQVSGAQKILDLFAPYSSSTDPTGVVNVNGVADPYGGHEFELYIKPLIKPEVQSVSPTTVPADGLTYNLTFSLARRLNPVQSPTMTISQTPGSSLTIGTVTTVKDSTGAIVAFKVPVSASPSSPTTNVTLTVGFAEASLEYLKNDVIVTEAVTYSSGVVLPTTVTIQQQSYPITFLSRSLGQPYGSYGAATLGHGASTDGASSGLQGMALYLCTLSSSANNFGSLKIVAKQAGTSNRIDVATATPDGAMVFSGGVYRQSYYALIDTGGTNLIGLQSFDIGAVAIDNTGKETTDWFSQPFINGNLSSQYGSWAVTISDGTTIWIGDGIAPNWGGTVPTISKTQSYGFGVREMWSYPQYLQDNNVALTTLNQEFIKKVELYIDDVLAASIPDTSAVSARKKISTYNPLVLPSFSAAGLTAGSRKFYFKVYSKATTYAGANIQTPDFFLNVVLTGGGPTGGGTGSCFVPETWVLTVDGAKQIKDIVPGNWVITVSEQDYLDGNCNLLTGRVQEVFKETKTQYQTAITNGIRGTVEHRWAVNSDKRKFLATKDMNGEALQIIDIHNRQIQDVAPTVTVAPDTDLVYNIHVPGLVTYLVGPSENGPWYLVHNRKVEYQEAAI